MSIVRLAVGTPSANTDTLLHESTRGSLISVMATNKSSSAATVRIWVKPNGATTESQYAYVSYDTPVPGNNSLETFRFAIENQDEVYVRSSTANVSFSINAIYETSGNQNIVTVSTAEPNAPDIGDVWVNPTTTLVSFWDGAVWTSAVGGSAGFPQDTEPAFPNQGAIWVDTDGEDPNYPEYPTVIYSPTEPTGLTVADTGTIWVDEDAAEMAETVVPAVNYTSTEPTGLGSTDAGYLWVDSDADIIEYNMNEYARNDEIISPMMLAGM